MRILPLIFLLIFNFCLGQDPYFVKYSIEEGLPTSNIYSVFEDANGYIWFTTDVGVIKYDGYDFKIYTTDDGLADNEIFKIYKDSKNKLWFYSLNGKLSYYQNKKFYNPKTTALLSKASTEQMIVDIVENNLGYIYVLFKDGRVSIFENDSVSKVIEDKFTSFALWIKNGKTLIVNSKNIKQLGSKKKLTHFDKKVSSKTFIRYVKKNDETYLYSIENRIYEFRNDTSKLILTVDSSEIINLSIIDDKLFIGTRNGLFVKEGDGIKHYFKEEQVSCSLKDSQGNLWVTTLDNGVKYIPNSKVFNQVFNSKNKTVLSLFKDSNNGFWVGAVNNLLKKSRNKNFALVNKYRVTRFREMDNSIYALSKQLYISNNQNEFDKIPIRINDIVKTKNSYIIATSSYVSKLNHEDFKYYLEHPILFEKELENYIIIKKRVNFLFNKKNKIYLGTSTGLFYFENDEFVKIESLNQELESSVVNLFYDDSTNKMFVSTLSKGVIILKDDKVVQQIQMKNNLSSNACNTVLKIENNRYIVGTNKGINILNNQYDSIHVEGTNSILGVKEMSVKDILINNDTLNLATSQGLISFHKNVLQNSIHCKPKLLINEVYVNGSEINALDNLNYSQNNISVSFTGLLFTSYGDLTYKYKLNDSDNWYKTKNKKIEFNSLSPGSYKLSISAIGCDEVYSDSKIIFFKIHPPFWKATPFVLAIMGLIGILLFYFIKRRFKQQKKQFELERVALKTNQQKILLEKQTAQLEQKALRLQMNPHFIFNALNTIKGYYSGGDIEEANVYINKFSKLLRLILENDEHLVSLEKEIEMLELYLKLVQLRYQNIFDYGISVSKNIKIDAIGMPPLLLQPIVENAIIHGIAPNTIIGKLNIAFDIKESKLICRVLDNGIGISVSKRNRKHLHQPKAIKITQERVQLINNSDDLSNFKIIELEKPTGTEVIIKLPIIKLW